MWSEHLPIFVDFVHPEYFVGIVVLPVIVLLSRHSLAGLGAVRGTLAVGMRGLVMFVLILALAEPQFVRKTDDQTVAFAVDQSDSIPSDKRRESAEFIERAVASMRDGKDRVALLSFAAQPSIDQLPRSELLPSRSQSSRETHQTNIGAALRLGLALFPSDTAKRMVVLTDGNENRGIAAQEADGFAALGIPIDVVPLRYKHAAEIFVDRLSAPSAVDRAEAIDLQLVVRSQIQTTARVTLYRNDRIVDLDASGPGYAFPIRLDAGPNRFAIPVELLGSDVHRFRAVVQPDDPGADSIASNNEGQAFTIVGDATRIVIVTDSSGEEHQADKTSAEVLAEALRASGLECDIISSNDLTNDPAALADTATIVLSNVSAFSLGRGLQETLASYVQDHGGGLVVLGGDQAFSVGGYAHTPLEEVLPVETSRDKLKLLSLSMVIVIDRSGSMAGEKLAMARQAASASVKLLSQHDRVGVIAFDGVAEWVVPLQAAVNRPAIQQRLGQIGGGGGTNMYPALEMAQSALFGVSTNLKHVIVLTDGRSTPGAFEELAERCGEGGITISAIAVGPDADRALLARIAERSGGRKYIADSARPLPQIFARETVLASRSGLYEQPFTPHLRELPSRQILAGINAADIPPLRGHVVTAAKPLASTPLVRPTEDGADPILSYWQAGLGRTVAFTSGVWPKWGPEWVSWPGFSKLWTQAVRYVARPGNPGNLEVQTSIQGAEAHVSVSAEHLSMRAQASLAVTAQVVAPDFSRSPLELQRTALGRFEASFPLDSPGTYLVNLPFSYGNGIGQQSGVLRSGVVQSYSPEYRALQQNEATITDLARRTGGRVLYLDHPEAVFEPWSIRPIEVRRPFWEDLVRLAMLLFLIDVAVRRIAITPAEVVDRLGRFIHDLSGPRPAPDSVGTLSALRGAKARAHAKQDAAPQESDASRPTPLHSRTEAQQPLSQDLANADSDQPVVARPASKPPPPAMTDSDYTSRLLRAKRRAHGQNDASPDER
jgi:Ca-activated chloride channel family protein